MEEAVIPYELPEVDDHSFFFIAQRIAPSLEAKLHRHDAWELCCVTHGRGIRSAGDTQQPFSAGEVVLIPPQMAHCWSYAPESADVRGEISYLMAAFAHSFVEKCMAVFPELRNRLEEVRFPTEALRLGYATARTIRASLERMAATDELGRACEMLRLLPTVFRSVDRVAVGRPTRSEKEARRMQRIAEYVMAHYVHPIALDGIAAEIGMNRSAFCTFFKKAKGITFSEFVTRYRLHTACGLLRDSDKQVAEICYLVGFRDIPHFVRVFTGRMGLPPTRYRALSRSQREAGADSGK